jgi:hypothetical protein
MGAAVKGAASTLALRTGSSDAKRCSCHAPCTAVVESAGLTAKQDKLHFDTPSLRELGVRYAAAMQRLQQSK